MGLVEHRSMTRATAGRWRSEVVFDYELALAMPDSTWFWSVAMLKVSANPRGVGWNSLSAVRARDS